MKSFRRAEGGTLTPYIMTSEGKAEAHLPSFEDTDLLRQDLLCKIQAGITNVAAMSLAINYPTAASVPHSIVKGLRNLRAIAAATEVTFKEAEQHVADANKQQEIETAQSQKQGPNIVKLRCCPL